MAKKTDVTIYHNPRCSTSRRALALLREQGSEPRIVEYLQTPLCEEELRTLLGKLGLRPIEVMRRKEKLFKELELAAKAEDDDTLIAAMAEHPILIERPIVVKGARGKVGRPAEAVLEVV